MNAVASMIGLSELDLMRVITVVIGLLFLTFSLITNSEATGEHGRVFHSGYRLNPKDQALVDMLDPRIHNYVITDPAKDDNPIVYASNHFCEFTKYSYDEIVGRNCRFLQGVATEKKDISAIRKAVKDEKDENVTLLNYKKDGTHFQNDFFICPLHDINNGKTVYYLGVQHEKVSTKGTAVAHTYRL